jgi:hypothetical protein
MCGATGFNLVRFVKAVQTDADGQCDNNRADKRP